jgi:hypothetical protein
LAAAWAIASSASAHDPPHGRGLLWTSAAPAAQPALIVANRGLVFADAPAGGATFSLRCYDAYGGGISEPPGVFFGAQNSLTIGVFNGVKATSDRACSLEPSSGLPADVESLGVVVQDAAVASRLFVTSRTFDNAALFVSEDFGHSWSKRFENRTDDYFHALLPAPADPLRLYAAGRRADRTNQKLVYFVAVSLDAGLSWQDHVLSAEILPFAVHPRDPDVLFAYQPTNVLKTEFRVLRSDDRGATFQTVIEGLPLPTSLADSGDASTLWLGVGGDGGLYRSNDDGRHFERVLADSVQSVTCLLYRHERLWMCANLAPNTDGVWVSDDQGSSFEKWMVFADVTQPVTCAQQDAQAVCDAAWRDFDLELHPRAPAGLDAGPGLVDASTTIEAGTGGGDAAVAPSEDDAALAGDAGAGNEPGARKRSAGCRAAPEGRAGIASYVCLGLVLAAIKRASTRRAAPRLASSAAAARSTSPGAGCRPPRSARGARRQPS